MWEAALRLEGARVATFVGVGWGMSAEAVVYIDLHESGVTDCSFQGVCYLAYHPSLHHFLNPQFQSQRMQKSHIHDFLRPN